MIYIVEDDRNIQEIELFALKNSGYQATGFETAKEFYKALNEKLPELILLDIMLPDEDGLSILKRLRSRADTQKIPVILVTAKTSEIDKVIARLNLTVDELQAEKLALSDALADISHQLKTPLTSIAISTELIRDRLSARGDSEDLVERLRLIQTLQARVEDLVSALLKLARIDAGVIKLVCGDIDARELVRKSFEPLAIAFDIADVRFSADVQDGASYEGDLTWSVEALENILKNCMEHTPTGGCVSVRVTEDVLACRIRIEDTGPGIAESDLPHIFERFYRGSRDASAAPSEVNPAGVGIGLALSKSLVTAQGGTLTAENLRDENGNITGAAFNLVFFKAVV